MNNLTADLTMSISENSDKSIPKKSIKAEGVQRRKSTISNNESDVCAGGTVKEKECKIVFKKMSDEGLSVSYDTILRGMLTPTELRKMKKEQSDSEKKS